MRDVRQLRADGMRETDVRNQTLTEKCGYAAARAVHKLIRNHEIQRLMLFLQRAYRAQQENALDAQHLHAINVGAEIQLGRRETMAPAVPRQECDFFASQLSDDIGVRRRPPGSFQTALFLRFKSGHRIQSAAANYSNGWVHACMSSNNTPPAEAGCTNT